MEGVKAFTALNFYDSIPESFFSAPPTQAHSVFGGPSLVVLRSKAPHPDRDPLFVSTLLHGNETTGWYALQKTLLRWKAKDLPRDLILFFGNTKAAQIGFRHLHEQPDFNRIWANSSEARALIDRLGTLKPYAAVDIHNTTGKNPHYSAIRSVSESTLALSSLFSPHVVHFDTPEGTLTGLLDSLCPSITIECGISGGPESETVLEVARYLETLLIHQSNALNITEKHRLSGYRSFAKIKVKEGFRISVEGDGIQDWDLCLRRDLDSKNFGTFEVGEHFAWGKTPDAIRILTPAGRDLTQNYLCYQDQEFTVRQEFTPSLISLNVEIIHSDALGYVMEPLALMTSKNSP